MYGKSLEIMPMKAWKLPKGKEHMRELVCSNGEYFGQIKKDGYWYQYEKDIEGNSFLFSRVISEETGHLSEKGANVPHIMAHLNARVPKGSILIGEIYYTHKTSKDVTKIMGCLPEKAIERQQGEYGWIHYYLHDVIRWNGEDLTSETNLTRLQILKNATQPFPFGYGLLDPFFIEFAVPIFDNLSEAIDSAFENGEEGMILKKKDGKYHPDKKPAWNWIKFKIEDDHDVICLGYEPPTKVYTGKEVESWPYWEDGKPVTKPYYMGWIGALKIGVLKDGEIIEIGTVSSGLTDEILSEIKAEPNKFIGKPVAVKCMMAGDNALRHPVFVRWRDDLNKTDCTWDKIFA